MTTSNKNEYSKAVSLFLAELLRNHRISLKRAYDIAEKTVANINLIDTEQQFLEFVKTLSSDFEELHTLGERFHIHAKAGTRKDLEQKVRGYVIQAMSSDMKFAAEVLEASLGDDVSEESLTTKFPGFKHFLEERKYE